MFAYANPKRFMDASSRFLPWLAAATALTLGAGLVLGLLAPPDYQQGNTVKIMFLHVPAAWTAMMAYGLLALTSFFSLVWRHPLSDVAAKAAAPLGAVFTVLGLVTG
ncbi:MAG: cytochrome c biogenesis protein CcsA, partial [Alphaproteobacteria bacterium]|nr:cytochrome c biogenesis protein CcsA [Alphaproteobacteria bacterium]